jgi:epoxyqueuosine reductase
MTVGELLNQERSRIVKELAAEVGFSFCGISKAEKLEKEAPKLEQWLKEGKHGSMGYMENHFDMRLDSRLLVPGARSVVSLMYNYYAPETQTDPLAPKISMYARGEDYHRVIKDRLKNLVLRLRETIGEVEGRVFTDSAPVLEKAWAERSGIGWIGKHTNLIHPKAGSWFFLAEIISDLELAPDAPARDHCGTCTRCMDACPTDAIPSAYVVDGSKCISYFTIELKSDVIPREMKGKFENWAFGCDICQQVCPWNRFSKYHNEPRFINEESLGMTKKDWYEMTEEVFDKAFRHTPLKRAGYKGIKRNLEFLL